MRSNWNCSISGIMEDTLYNPRVPTMVDGVSTCGRQQAVVSARVHDGRMMWC
eukprot:m.52414 g.52414  ORF g.52414 m.52414 type:complete len:52 (+) comp7369_c0_seq2:725-880(+)